MVILALETCWFFSSFSKPHSPSPVASESPVSQSVQSLSRVRLFATPWTSACQASLSITNSQSLPKLKSIELVMPSNHLKLCRPLLLLPSIFPSIRVFSNESALHIRWLKYWSFSISPSNEYSGLISFMMDWFDLLAVQGTLKSPPAPQFVSYLDRVQFLQFTSRLAVSDGSQLGNCPKI